MKKILNKKGFTLVELMVVVAIMGILVAIAVPVYNNVTSRAEATVCEANLRTYDSAVMQWLMDPANTDLTSATLNDMSAYMKDGAVTCPSGGKYTFTATNNSTWTFACDKHPAT